MSKQTYFGNNFIASLDGGDISYNNSGTGLSKTDIILKGIKLVKEEIENGQN